MSPWYQRRFSNAGKYRQCLVAHPQEQAGSRRSKTNTAEVNGGKRRFKAATQRYLSQGSVNPNMSNEYATQGARLTQ